MDEAGAPSIPAKFANILLPSGAQNVSISASGEWTLLAEGITPYPAQPRSPKSKPRPAFVPANDRYASAEAWPADMATYQGDHDMQGYRFVSVRVNPLAYVGAEKTLYLRETVTVTVTYDAAVATRRRFRRSRRATFEPLVDSLVVNPAESAATFAPKVRTVEPKAALDYLIITSSGAEQRVPADRGLPVLGGGRQLHDAGADDERHRDDLFGRGHPGEDPRVHQQLGGDAGHDDGGAGRRRHDRAGPQLLRLGGWHHRDRNADGPVLFRAWAGVGTPTGMRLWRDDRQRGHGVGRGRGAHPDADGGAGDELPEQGDDLRVRIAGDEQDHPGRAQRVGHLFGHQTGRATT